MIEGIKDVLTHVILFMLLLIAVLSIIWGFYLERNKHSEHMRLYITLEDALNKLSTANRTFLVYKDVATGLPRIFTVDGAKERIVEWIPDDESEIQNQEDTAGK